MTIPTSNGNGKLVWWLLGLLSTIVLGTSTGWVTTTYNQVRIHGEHIAVLQAQVEQTHDELQRINHKLDQLLERQRRP